MIDVSDILNDPDLCSEFTIRRNPGKFAAGGWQQGTPQVIQAFGAVRNTSGREIEQIPEGDRVREMITVRSTTPMYATDAAQNITADVIIWQGSEYRVAAVKQYLEQGMYSAVAGRMAGK